MVSPAIRTSLFCARGAAFAFTYWLQYLRNGSYTVTALVQRDFPVRNVQARRERLGIPVPAWRYVQNRMAHGQADPRTQAEVDGDTPLVGADEVAEVEETYVGGKTIGSRPKPLQLWYQRHASWYQTNCPDSLLRLAFFS